MSSKAEIPVVAENALKYLFFQLVERRLVKLRRGKNAVGVEPCLKAGIDAVEVEE